MSSSVKWFKLMNNMFDDEKIEYIESLPDGESILIIWIKILCLASKTNNNGCLMITDEIPYTSDLLANKFKKTTVQIDYALTIMQKLGMVDIYDNIIYVSNWAKYQSVDELEKIREQTRLRVARYRENKKQIECNATCNATVALKCNDFVLNSNSNSISNNINIEEKEKETKKSKRFVPPTLEEIQTYIDERHSPVDAQQFYDYFNTGNWVDSNGNKVKNWKQKLLTWEKFAKDNTKNKDNFFDILDSIQ